MTKIEKTINAVIDKTRQKMVSICKNEYKNDLDFSTASIFIGQIKELISDLGREVVGSYFESRDECVPFIEKNATRYLYKGKSLKSMITSIGKIEVRRSYYQNRSGGPSQFPLDKKLGVDREMLMSDVKELVLYCSAYNTPEESARLLSKCSLINVNASQIKRSISSTNDFMEGVEATIMDKVRCMEEVPASEVLVCSLDGVNVLLNQRGAKKGRPMERPVKESAPSSSYKNAMCGSISHYKLEENQGKKEPKRIASKYIARMPEDSYPTFKAELEKEVKQANSASHLSKLVITDAHPSIMGYLKDNPKFKDYERIIDFFHAAEHLSLIAEAIHGKSSQQATDYYIKYRDILKNDKEGVWKLIRSVGYYLTSRSFNKTQNQHIHKHLNYFKKHKQHMRYKQYIENGWPIGSGVIEAACKSVIKQRMCRSGQRWSIKGGQAILSLRAIVKSDRWNSFWKHFSSSYYNRMAA